MQFSTIVVALFAGIALAAPAALEARQQVDSRCTACRLECFNLSGPLQKCLDSSCNVAPLNCKLTQ
ncbi:hypothetical protein LZ30DRAFT_825813 [Colletotrichum cereale]|nr:hypothetical protein LZ30DRAFT_825813 [Colletotrichum cereale]